VVPERRERHGEFRRGARGSPGRFLGLVEASLLFAGDVVALGARGLGVPRAGGQRTCRRRGGGGCLPSAAPLLCSLGALGALDLYADLGLLWWQWLFFFFLIFAWSWIVHATARSAVQFDDWVCEAHVGNGLGGPEDPTRRRLRHEYYWPALLVPRFLGLAVF